MAITLTIFKILIVLTSILAEMALGYDLHSCSDIAAWQPGCSGPGSVACDVPYESGAYCISKCYNNVCSYSRDAARDFKKHICQSYGYSTDYISAANNEVDLAIQRFKSSSCGSYERTFDFVPYAAWYPIPETHPDRIPK